MPSTTTFSPRILIAEDNQIICSQLSSLLQKEVVQLADRVSSIDEKLHMPEDERPELIISNIQLADAKMSYNFIEEISRIWNIPLIILTGYGRKMLSPEILDLPNVYFLQKPFLPFQLRMAVQNALNTNL